MIKIRLWGEIMLRKFVFFAVLALLLVFLAIFTSKKAISKKAIASKEEQKLKEITETKVSDLIKKRITQFSTIFEKVLFEREKESFDNSDTSFSEGEYTKKAAPTFPANFAKQISAAELWYPGGINSQWVYNQPFGEKVTATYTKNVEFEGRTYKLVEEDNPSFWLFDPSELGPDPFLTFRKGETNQILGCGVAANEFFEKFIIELLIEMGIPKEILQVQSIFDEWVLLENPAAGHNWTVMKVEVEATLFPGAKVQCVI